MPAPTTYLELLIAERLTCAQNLYQLERDGPLKHGVDYSVDGRNVSWTQAKRYYTDQMDKLNDLIQRENGPFMESIFPLGS